MPPSGGQTGDSFVWNVPTNLETGEYAFEITDGSAINYSLQFPISGDGSAATGVSSATASATSAGSATASASASASASATVTVTTSAGSSVTAVTSSASESETDVSSASASSASVESASSSIGKSRFYAGEIERQECRLTIADDDVSSAIATVTSGILTTTRTSRPTATETDDNEPSQVPDSGAAGNAGSALLGAIVGLGALLMAY